MKIYILFLFLFYFSIRTTAQVLPTEEVKNKFLHYENNKICNQTKKIKKNNDKYLKSYDKNQLKFLNKLCKTNPQMSDALYKSWYASRDRLKRELDGSLKDYPLPLMKNDLQQNNTLISANYLKDEQLSNSIKDYNLQSKNVDVITEYMREQNSILRNVSNEIPDINSNLIKLEKNEYYFVKQNDVFNQLFNKQSKIESSLFSELLKDNSFKKYLDEKSILSNFKIPENWGVDDNTLQTVSEVNKLQHSYLSQLDSGEKINALSGFGLTEKLINELKSKGISNVEELPNFRVNEMKTKSILERFSYGFDFQPSSSTQSYYPNSIICGLTIKYKFNSIVSSGINLNYDFSFGYPANSIRNFSNKLKQRAFIDAKIINIFYLTGEIEKNNIESKSNEFYKHPYQYDYGVGLKVIQRVSDKLSVTSTIIYKFQTNNSTPILFRFGFEH